MNDRVKLQMIFERTNGRCHITGKKLCFSNYNRYGRRGAWEIEHSVPKARGGTDHGNNLYPALISANRSKQDYTTRTARRWHGRSAAPLSKTKVAEKKNENTMLGLAGGAFAGLCLAGPAGALLGAMLGGAVGESIKVQ